MKKRTRRLTRLGSKKSIIAPPIDEAADERRRRETGERIEMLMDERELTQHELAAKLSKKNGAPLQRTAISNWKKGRDMNVSTLTQLANVLESTPAFIGWGITDEPKVVPPDPATLGYVLVTEVIFGKTAKDRTEIQKWGIPTQYLRGELNVADVNNLVIYKTQVDSNGHEFGDRLLVDCSVDRPSPPGNFLHWDGYGATISQIQVIPGAKKPVAKVTNVSGSYEIDADKLEIIGRVRGTWRKA